MGVCLEHYRCQKVVAKNSEATMISDTIEFGHQKITLPKITPEEKIIKSMYK